MTKNELLEAIDEEIEETRIIYAGQDYWLQRVGEGKVEALQWVRDLIEKPPGSPWGWETRRSLPNCTVHTIGAIP